MIAEISKRLSVRLEDTTGNEREYAISVMESKEQQHAPEICIEAGGDLVEIPLEDWPHVQEVIQNFSRLYLSEAAAGPVNKEVY